MDIRHLGTQRSLSLRSLIISLGLIFTSAISYAQLRADLTPAQSVTGAWVGHYQCRGERHPLLLKIRETRNGRLHAHFNAIYEGSDYLSFNMRGSAKRVKGKVRLSLVPREWVERPHRDLISVPLTGRLRGQRLTGRIDHPKCGIFEVTRLQCGLNSADPCSRGVRGRFARFLDRHGERKPRKASASTLTTLRVPARQAIGEETFNPLMRQLQDASFHNQKLSLLKLVIEHHYFTVAQTQQILQEFSFDSHRLTALKLLAPRIDTLTRVFTILESFTFQSNKRQAQKILNTAQKAAQLHEERERLAALERARAVQERRQARQRRRERERERRRDRRRARDHDDGDDYYDGHDDHDDSDHHNFHAHDDHERTTRETRRETRRERSTSRRERRDEDSSSGMIARVFAGERCPAGWMLAPYKWVEANPTQACNAAGMGSWYITRIAGGGSQDGIGYQCKRRRTDHRELGHALCIQRVR